MEGAGFPTLPTSGRCWVFQITSYGEFPRLQGIYWKVPGFLDYQLVEGGGFPINELSAIVEGAGFSTDYQVTIVVAISSH